MPVQRLLTIAALLAYAAILPASHAEHYDVLFRGVSILDGTGLPSFNGDLAVRDGRIAAIGDLSTDIADRSIDAAGLTLIPGIIDLHSHADGTGDSSGLRSRDPKRRAAPNLVAQGVTTVVVNQDGRSPLDLERQRLQLEERGFGPNTVLMVGHNTIRRVAMQGTSKKRTATAAEVEAMRELLREGMDAGAWGLTAGLEYEPGIWSDTDELITLVRDIVPCGGVYIVHERASGSDPMWYSPSRDAAKPSSMLDSIHETIRIAESTGAMTVATHVKARGTNYWGKSVEIIDAIESARTRGVRIAADHYPYTTSGSDGTIVLIPRWVTEDYLGDSTDYVGALLHALSNPKTADEVTRDVHHKIMRRGGPSNIVVLSHPDSTIVGKTLTELAVAHETTPIEMVYRLQLEGYRDRFGGALLRGFSMNENDVRAFAALPWVATASDAGIALPDDGLLHARHYGTFPRKIREYALDRNVLSVEQAVNSMTGLPASIMGFTDRGRIEIGLIADIALIDLEEIRDTATFFEPHQMPKGIPFVLVNGTFVIDQSTPTFAHPGEVLRRPDPIDRQDTDD